MSISFQSALGIHEAALRVRGQRAAILASNLANVDTPNYKARDLDFKSMLNQQSELLHQNDGSHSNQNSFDQFAVKTTHENHFAMDTTFGESNDVLYRTPQQASIDGNTVEDQIEHAEYMKNTLAFQASFQFLNQKFQGLRTAIRGD